MKKRGTEKRRTWCKLHLAVDLDVDTHEVISTEVILVNVRDSEVLPKLLNPLRREVTGLSMADSRKQDSMVLSGCLKWLTCQLSSI